jgi:RNA polymerase sigma factor (sigma-70 family)
MATGRTGDVLQHLRRAVLLRDGAGLTDGELLERFVSRREEEALAALVRRHGPMVWGVCRRIVPNYHDAEDAFQATFLVLVRRAASVVPRALVGNWLYGVAYQTALKARATAARRRTRERQVTDMPEPPAAPQDLWNDLQPLLDQELSRLPDRYRAVVLLCDLEGKTRREVARQLGVPEGTVAGRLARARVLLAKRLAGRGLAVSGGALAAALSEGAASAGVPPAVVTTTIHVAGAAVAGGAVPLPVAALAEGVLKAMLLTRLKIATAGLLLVGAIGVGVTFHTLGAEPPATFPGLVPVARPPQADPGRPGEPAPPDLGFYPPARRLVEAARAKDPGKAQTIAAIESGLKELAEAKDDKAERKALDKIDHAVRWYRDYQFQKKELYIKYPEELKSQERPGKSPEKDGDKDKLQKALKQAREAAAFQSSISELGLCIRTLQTMARNPGAFTAEELHYWIDLTRFILVQLEKGLLPRLGRGEAIEPYGVPLDAEQVRHQVERARTFLKLVQEANRPGKQGPKEEPKKDDRGKKP